MFVKLAKFVLGVILGVIVGAFAGGATGFVAAIALMYVSQFLNPNDPSAGSVGIIVLATLPGGVVLGGITGGLLGAWKWRPR
jgi:hypothetical protein